MIEVDVAAAAERRRRVQARARVGYRKGDDGLVDLFLEGISGPLAQACLLRIRALSAPVSGDVRSADCRRLEAAVDVLLGRVGLPVDGVVSGAEGCSSGCGCRLGAPAPCGAQVVVHVPLGGALGITDEAAEVVGHGPVEADLLQQILLSAPQLRAVFVDADGLPVAVGEQVWRVARDDPAALREALLALTASRPGERFPRDRHDHASPAHGRPRHDRPPEHRPPDDRPPDNTPPDNTPPDDALPAEAGAEVVDIDGVGPEDGCPDAVGPQDARRDGLAHRADPARRGIPEGGSAHPADSPGPYRLRPRLRRAVAVRAPRCEWPAFGVRAGCCDLDHDQAHPDGPTCSCNLGPLCRRHHQVKQQGWSKVRRPGGVRFTSPTGRSWLSRLQHTTPAPPVHPLPAVPRPSSSLGPLEASSELELERELWSTDPGNPCWDDPQGLELRAVDLDPDRGEMRDDVQERLTTGDTRWSLDLADPYAWLEPAALIDPRAELDS